VAYEVFDNSIVAARVDAVVFRVDDFRGFERDAVTVRRRGSRAPDTMTRPGEGMAGWRAVSGTRVRICELTAECSMMQFPGAWCLKAECRGWTGFFAFTLTRSGLDKTRLKAELRCSAVDPG